MGYPLIVQVDSVLKRMPEMLYFGQKSPDNPFVGLIRVSRICNATSFAKGERIISSLKAWFHKKQGIGIRVAGL